MNKCKTCLMYVYGNGKCNYMHSLPCTLTTEEIKKIIEEVENE